MFVRFEFLSDLFFFCADNNLKNDTNIGLFEMIKMYSKLIQKTVQIISLQRPVSSKNVIYGGV